MEEEHANRQFNLSANEIKSVQEKLITPMPESFRKPLMEVAYKLLSGDQAKFNEFTP